MLLRAKRRSERGKLLCIFTSNRVALSQIKDVYDVISCLHLFIVQWALLKFP